MIQTVRGEVETGIRELEIYPLIAAHYEAGRIPLCKAQAGDCIADAGDSGCHIIYLLRGDVKIFSFSYKGRRMLLDQVGRGEFSGHISKLRGFNFDSTIVARSDCMYLEFSDDLFQETFMKAIITLQEKRYAANGKFGAWLTRIAHNLIIDQFRTERNENTISNDESDTELFESSDLTDRSLEMELVNEQTLKDVRRLMDHLPAAQREVVFMRYYQNLSFKEISETTGVSINTALGRMRYAILNMRRMASEHNLSLTML